MTKETVGYYQSNIRTSRDEGSVCAMTYANQQLLIDKLQQENQKYKEVIDKAKYWVEDYMNEWDTDDDVWQELNELLILLEEVE